MRHTRIIATALMLGTVTFGTLAASAPTLAADPATLSVTGTGIVSATPDMATVTSGVTTQGPTAGEALAANSKAMADLLAALTAAGIADKDVQTSNFSVNPNYIYSDLRDANGYTLPPRIDGYVVFNTVNVTIRDLTQLGAVLDKQVTVGANTINGISFGVNDPSALLDEARKHAFEDAKRKAELYATAAGEELGPLVSITEMQGYSSPQPYLMKAMSAAADAAPVPVAAGSLDFQVDVNVIWNVAY
jgi:uncharacterized protein YggE